MSFLSNIFGHKKKEVVVDYNTLKIKSVSQLDDFEKIKVKKELESLYEKIKIIAESDTIEQKQHHAEKNDVCPNCTSTEITHRIETSSKSSGYGKYSSTESVKTKINVCGKCFEEWEHDEFRAYTTSKYELAENIIRFLRYYHEEKHKVEDDDPNSLETIVADSQNKIINGHWAKEVKKYMDGCSVELAKYLVEVVYGEFSSINRYDMEDWDTYDKAPLLEIGFKENKL